MRGGEAWHMGVIVYGAFAVLLMLLALLNWW